MLLESRLNNLEGKGKKITSKDILTALSEARDDHLTNASTTTAYVNEFAVMDEVEPEEKTARCCGLCGNGYLRRRGWGDRHISDADRQEYACLIDCDELEMNVRHETSTRNDNKSNHPL